MFARLGNFIAPPPPKYQVVLGFGELKDRFRFWHYLLAVCMLSVFLGLMMLQFQLWDGFLYSPLLLFLEGALLAYDKGILWFAGFLLATSFIPGLVPGKKPHYRGSTYSSQTVGFLSQAAVAEEQWFREGAENWSRFGRIRSAFAFGFIHLGNLFYPIATILPLMLCGLVFNHVYMSNYRRTRSSEQAVLSSAVAHRVYNRVAIAFIVGVAVWAIFYPLVKGLINILM